MSSSDAVSSLDDLGELVVALYLDLYGEDMDQWPEHCFTKEEESEEDEEDMEEEQEDEPPNEMDRAAFFGDLETVQRLVRNSSKKQRKVVLNYARRWTEQTTKPLRSVLMRKMSVWYACTPLMTAALRGNAHVVKYLLEQGADPTLRACPLPDKQVDARECAALHLRERRLEIKIIRDRLEGWQQRRPKRAALVMQTAHDLLAEVEWSKCCIRLVDVALGFWNEAPYASSRYHKTNNPRNSFSNQLKDREGLHKALQQVSIPSPNIVVDSRELAEEFANLQVSLYRMFAKSASKAAGSPPVNECSHDETVWYYRHRQHTQQQEQLTQQQQNLPTYECSRCHHSSRNFTRMAMKRIRKGSEKERCLTCIDEVEREEKQKSQNHPREPEEKPSPSSSSTMAATTRFSGRNIVTSAAVESKITTSSNKAKQAQTTIEKKKTPAKVYKEAPPAPVLATEFECKACHKTNRNFHKNAMKRMRQTGKAEKCLDCKQQVPKEKVIPNKEPSSDASATHKVTEKDQEAQVQSNEQKEAPTKDSDKENHHVNVDNHAVAKTSTTLPTFVCSRCNQNSRNFGSNALKRLSNNGGKPEPCLNCKDDAEQAAPQPKLFECKTCHKINRNYRKSAIIRMKQTGKPEKCLDCKQPAKPEEKSQPPSNEKFECRSCKVLSNKFDDTNLQKAKCGEPIYCISCIEKVAVAKTEKAKADEKYAKETSAPEVKQQQPKTPPQQQLPAYECSRCHTSSRNFSKNAMKRIRKGSSIELCIDCISDNSKATAPHENKETMQFNI